MNLLKHKPISKKSALFVALLLAGGYSFAVAHAATDSVTQLSQEAEDAEKARQKQLDEINAKIKSYKQIIQLKSQQGTTLANQIASLEAQASELELEIRKNRDQINSLQSDITSLTTRIAEKSLLIEQQKKMLSELLRAYYTDYSNDTVPLLLSSEETAAYFHKGDWSTDVNDKVSDLLDSVKTLRDSLVEEQAVLQDKKAQADALHAQLNDQNEELDSTKNNKEDLLSKTQSDEQKYQQLLSRVEAQKQELLDFSSASNIGAVSDSVKDYPQPDKSDWASTSWYFSQKDSRWGSKRIGNSSSLMRDYGCAVTAVAMVLREHGAGIDPGKLAQQKIFSYDLINWPTSYGGTDLVSSTSHGNISWSKIDSEIKKGNPVIVHINKSNGGGHYVVVTGKDSKDYIVHDPYFGPNIYLSTSRSLIGKLGKDGSTRVDQMIIYH